MAGKENLVAKWIERADYDLSAAEAMQRSGHWLYVAFLCQQSVEKVLKAVWCLQRDDSPPFTHNLGMLAESVRLSLSEPQLQLLDRLSRHYIVGRYPTFKQKLATSLNDKDAASILSETKEFVTWCRKFIPTSDRL